MSMNMKTLWNFPPTHEELMSNYLSYISDSFSVKKITRSGVYIIFIA